MQYHYRNLEKVKRGKKPGNKLKWENTKGGFFPESAIRFLDLQILKKKKYSKKLS